MRRGELLVVALVALVAFGALALLVAPLSTPICWDAGAVYAPGAKWLHDHGFDARPGVFPHDLSRGHTPLYYLILAALFRLAGPGPVPGHALAFVAACAAVVIVYALGRDLWGRTAGVLAAAMLLSAPLFLTMACEDFPEMPMTALTAATFLAFARGNLAATTALGTLLVLVKEPGIACPVAIAGAMILEASRTGRLREEKRRIAVALVPAAVVGVFFCYQKAAAGFWITSYHDELYHAEHSILEQLWRVARSIYVDDGRIVAVLGAAALFAFGHGPNAGTAPEERARRSRVLVALALHALFNLAFFAKSFYLERYTLPVHVGAAVVLAGILSGAGRPLRARAPALAAAALSIVVALSRREAGDDMVSGETSLRYLHAVHAQAALLGRLDAAGDAPVVLTDWPLTDALRQPFLGWVSRPFQAFNVSESEPWAEAPRDRPLDPATRPHVDRVVAVPALGSYRRLVREAEAMGFQRIDHAEEGPASIELWGPPGR